jgi:hypothetical protein
MRRRVRPQPSSPERGGSIRVTEDVERRGSGLGQEPTDQRRGQRTGPGAERQSVLTSERNAPLAPDLSHPSMRSWLETLPRGRGRSAAFETRIWWSPGGATEAIADKLAQAGYPPLRKARRFVVKGKYGPLRDGEIDRARRWGAELAEAMR